MVVPREHVLADVEAAATSGGKEWEGGRWVRALGWGRQKGGGSNR